MSFHHSPKIVTNGLVLCLDAANPKCYPGSGTICTDLSNNVGSGILTNSPVFNSENNGSIQFNGTNYINFGNTYTGLDLTSKTFQVWIKKTSSSQKGIIDKDFDNGGSSYGGWGFWVQSNNKLWWWNHGNQDILDNGPNTFKLNTWANISVTYNYLEKKASFYINSVLNSSITNNNIIEKASGSANLLVGGLRNNLAGYNFDGSISMILAYNRALTPAEILQNYNAVKGRFQL